MKKVLSAVCAVLMMSVLALPAFAAASKDDILKELEAGVKVGDQVKEIPSDYIKVAKDFLDANDLTDDQLTGALADVKEAKAIWAATGKTEFKDIPSDVQNQLINKATAAAKKVGATLTFDGKTVKVTDKAGKVYTVVKAGDAIKQTGGSMNTTGLLVVSILALTTLVGAVVVTRKNNLVEDR